MNLTNPKALFLAAFESELSDLQDAGHDPNTFRAAGKRATKANPHPTGEDAAWWRTHGPDMVKRWMEWRRESKWRIWTAPTGEPAIELALSVTVDGLDEPLDGIIDRVFEVHPSDYLCLVDVKSGARSPESDMQLAVYRYMLRRAYGVDVKYGGYWMARKGEVTPVSIEHFDTEMVARWYRQFVIARREGVFIPHMSNLCKACSHNKFCAAWGGSMSHLDPDSPNYKPEEGEQ